MSERLFEPVGSVCVPADTSIRQAMEVIDRHASGIALVTDADGRLIATVTDGDIRRAILAQHGLNEPVSTILTDGGRPSPAAVTAPASTTRAALLEIMAETGLQQIPLLDDSGRVVDLALLKTLTLAPEPALQAVIMAGGFGTRLLPLTEDCPKPMLPVGDRPLMEWTLERLRAAGIRHVSVATHYLHDKITDHFGDGSRFGMNLHYLRETRPLGTAGALSLLEGVAEPMLVINGDVVTDLDFRAMRQFHAEHGAAATVAVARYDIQIPYGVIRHEGVNVTGLAEKPVVKQFINAGVYLIEPRTHAHIPRDTFFNMTDLIERLIAAGERVIVFPVREYWVDIGQPADYQRVQNDMSEGVIKATHELPA